MLEWPQASAAHGAAGPSLHELRVKASARLESDALGSVSLDGSHISYLCTHFVISCLAEWRSIVQLYTRNAYNVGSFYVYGVGVKACAGL